MKKKALYLLLSVAIAVGMWVYVVTTVSPEWEETYYDIPVTLKNETVLHDNGLMLLDEKQPTVTLRLKGNRSDLVNLNKANITLIADLAKIYTSGQQSIAYDISYPGNVPNNAIEVMSQSPKEITLTVAERRTKEIEVVPIYTGTVPEGFRTDKEDLLLDHETVTVTGPATVIDQITAARITVDLEGQTETISQSYRYTLCDAAGNAVDSAQVTTDVEEISLTLKIQRYKEIQLVLNVIPGGGATGQNSLIQMDMESIQVSGSEQLLQSIGDTLEFEIRLAEILEDTTVQFDIKLPEGVENLTGKSVLTVRVSFPNLETRTFQVSNISARNVPVGMKVDILTKELTVTIRGNADQILNVTAEDLSVIVDLATAELGTDTYKALVYVDSRVFPDVGAVDTYKVDVKVTAADEAV